LRTDINTRLDAELEFGGPWSIRSGATQTTQTNEQLILALSEYRATSVDLGLRYMLGSGSTLTYTTTSTAAKTLNRALSTTNLFDDGYSEIDHQLGAHWAIGGNSTADLYATSINRSYPNFSQRDFSGVNAGASINWNITGKSALYASWSRETSSYQTASTNTVQTDRLSISPVWQFSPKAMLRLRIDLIQRDYLDSLVGLSVAPRRDNLQDASLSLNWQLYQYVTLSTSLQNSRRTVNQPGLDFDSTLTSISAQFTY
jgi:hypothetical protein